MIIQITFILAFNRWKRTVQSLRTWTALSRLSWLSLLFMVINYDIVWPQHSFPVPLLLLHNMTPCHLRILSGAVIVGPVIWSIGYQHTITNTACWGLPALSLFTEGSGCIFTLRVCWSLWMCVRILAVMLH